MKKDLHPKGYQLVVYKDSNSGDTWLTRSTATSKETIKHTDGNEYPLILVEVSSKSHPFFTGDEKVLDIEGRVDKFKKRQEAAAKAQAARTPKAEKEKKPKEEQKI
jgi:large subunit ribosomal protein L31